MSYYLINGGWPDGHLVVSDGERTEKLSTFATAGIKEVYGGQLLRLEQENDTLRELARHMGACIQRLDRTDEDGGCVRCPYQTVEHDCGFEQRMVELGIEVDA